MLVFWISAYGGRSPIKAYAMLFHYYIIPARGELPEHWINMVNTNGDEIECTSPRKDMVMATIDTDRVYLHGDHNDQRTIHLIKSLPKGYVKMDLDDESNHIILTRTDEGFKNGLNIRKLLPALGIEPLRDYQIRSRRHVNELRHTGQIYADDLRKDLMN